MRKRLVAYAPRQSRVNVVAVAALLGVVASSACGTEPPEPAPSLALESISSDFEAPQAATATSGLPDVSDLEMPTGVIQGTVRLAGDSPGNAVIRMGVDPHCAELTKGKLIVQERVLTGPDGGLANAVIRLEGSFPETAVPADPVVIHQQDCVFVPRVVGVRAGQLVQIINSDPVLHNLNSVTTTTNRFNIGQPVEGMVYEFRPVEEAGDGLLRIRCDLHRWMTEYIAVVPHPYFAVTDQTGTFRIEHVPVGTQTIRVWHEEYGTLMQEVTVEADAAVAAEFVYDSPS